MLLACCSIAIRGLLPPTIGADSLPATAALSATPAPNGPFEIPGAVPVSMVIENLGASDRLLGGSTPVAAWVELHETRLVDGKRSSYPLPDGIVVPGGTSVILEPGAKHLMLFALTTELVQGDTFPLTLRFERAGDVQVTARVRRKVDAAGVEPIPPVAAGGLRISLASAPPAPKTASPPPNAAGIETGVEAQATPQTNVSPFWPAPMTIASGDFTRRTLSHARAISPQPYHSP